MMEEKKMIDSAKQFVESLFAGAMEEFREQVAEWEEEEEEQEYEDLVAYVYRLSKQELRERLIEALIELEEKDFF